MKSLLDYNGNLVMYIPESETQNFVASGFYKISLRRYVKSVEEGKVNFKTSLNYIDYKKIIDLCKKRIEGLEVSKTLMDYIEGREIYIEERSRLGMELKNKDPKLQIQYEQYKNVVNSSMVRPLREQQMWDSFYLCAMQRASNFSVPGSGKTAAVLGMYAYLKAKSTVKRILVVCPKNAFGSWIDEFKACFGDKETLSVLNIHDVKYKNTFERRNAIRYESGKCNLILVNYESVGGVEDALLEIIDNKTMLVFDEVHKVKRIGGEYARHALELSKGAYYTVAMTGTPIPNTYSDIYNLLHILFNDEYNTFFDFSIPVLNKPNDYEINEVNDKIQPFFCRTTKDQLGVPNANEDLIYCVKANDEENRILRILQMKYRKNKLALFIRLMQLESNPKMLLQRLELKDFQYLLDDSVDTDEIDFADYSQEILDLINNCKSSEKFKSCVNLTQSLVESGKTAIIWCIFVDSIRRLAKELSDIGIKVRCVYGEVPLEERLEIIESFKRGEIQVLLTNPHTLAESVSLHTVCHDAIYFEYSYNLVHLLQSKDRIHRLGLPENQYTQYYFMEVEYETDDGFWSMDDHVYTRLKEKEKVMLDAIDKHILETMPTTQEELDMIFENLFN